MATSTSHPKTRPNHQKVTPLFPNPRININKNQQTPDINGYFNGAALVDENGQEIRITERMVQQACKALVDSWLFPRMNH